MWRRVDILLTDISEEHIGSSLVDFLYTEVGGDTLVRNVGYTVPTRRHIPEDSILHSHRCETLKSYTESILL
jgi:hypothetical protein